MTEELKPQPSAAQSAPAGEREAFEAAVVKVALANGYSFMGELLKRDAEGSYRQSWVDSSWLVHQAWQRAQSAPVVPEGYAIVPVTATAENGAKAALLGEFSIANETICTGCYYGEADDDCEVCGGETHYTEHVTVPWDTIKEIYAEAVLVLAAPQPACATCNDNGRIGGPSFYSPDEGGDPCPDCTQPAARQEHGLAAQVRKAQAEIDTWPDSVRKNHGLPARHDHGDEVQRLREALEEIRHADMNAPVSESNAGCIKRIKQIAERTLSASESQA